MQSNPAMIGVYNGLVRVNSSYREQWSSTFSNVPFRTILAGADYRWNVLDDDYIGFVASAQRSEGGSDRFIKQNAELGVSFLKQLSGDRRGNGHYLTAGLQVGVGQHKTGTNSFWFSNQFENTKEQIDLTLPSGENFPTFQSNVFVNMNAGLLWYSKFENDNSFFVGAALQHLNSPNVSLVGHNEPLARKFQAQIGTEIYLNRELSLLPALLWMQQRQAQEWLGGIALRYSNHEWQEVALRAGIWTRITRTLQKQHQDALILSTFMEMGRLNIGISYDLNTSILSQVTQGRGAYELSLQYIIPEEKKERVKCPRM